MVWHYIENGQQAGPVDEATFRSLVSSGRITGNTHVWREGMPDWALYSTIAASMAGGAAVGAAVGTAVAPVEGGTQCAECGNYFQADDLVLIGDRAVCAACKPIAVQKLKEGVVQTVVLEYAGFWMRFLASFVDGLIMIPVFIVYFYILMGHKEAGDPVRIAAEGMMYVIGITYSTLLIGKYGSTLGMMVCGIRVVRPDGEKVSYLRALGRYFAAILSGWTLGIGYIMIAFDEQKRSLHDRICDTRVIYKK